MSISKESAMIRMFIDSLRGAFILYKNGDIDDNQNVTFDKYRVSIAKVKEALKIVPERQRIVFERYIIGGQSCSQISDDLQIQMANIPKYTVHAARKMIQWLEEGKHVNAK